MGIKNVTRRSGLKLDCSANSLTETLNSLMGNPTDKVMLYSGIPENPSSHREQETGLIYSFKHFSSKSWHAKELIYWTLLSERLQ